MSDFISWLWQSGLGPALAIIGGSFAICTPLVVIILKRVYKHGWYDCQQALSQAQQPVDKRPRYLREAEYVACAASKGRSVWAEPAKEREEQ